MEKRTRKVFVLYVCVYSVVYTYFGSFFVQIIFEGVSGNDQKGDIAIDDFTVQQSPCTVYPAGAAPGKSYTRHHNRNENIIGHKCFVSDQFLQAVHLETKLTLFILLHTKYPNPFLIPSQNGEKKRVVAGQI